MNGLEHVTVLLSGGLDSAACLAYYSDRGNVMDAVFVDHGQGVARRERESARSVAAWYGIRLVEIDSRAAGPIPRGEVPGRNAFLVFAAMTLAEIRSGLLALGIHDGTGYYDCSPHFLESINGLVTGYADGRLSVVAPFLTWGKGTVWQFGQTKKVPMHLTWSCEIGPVDPCGKCRSCVDVETLRACS